MSSENVIQGSGVIIEHVPTLELVAYARNSRTHSDEQIGQIAASIREFGFCNPVLIDAANNIIAGHGRVLAMARFKPGSTYRCGLFEYDVSTVPCLRLTHLTDAQKRAYVLADNRIALSSGWDSEMLSNELSDLHADEFDMALLGFNADELSALMGLQETKKRDDELKAAVTQSLQVIPGKEYCLILCDSETEWSQLREMLGLGLVSRGGYKQESAFNSVGAERVITMSRLMERLNNADSDPV